MQRSDANNHHELQSCLALNTFAKSIERAGFQIKSVDKNATITSTKFLQNLSGKTTKQAIKDLDNYKIIDNRDDNKEAEFLKVNLITYDYCVKHKKVSLSSKNPNKGIDIMRDILTLEIAGEQHGNSIENNNEWEKLNLPKPNQFDLFQPKKKLPSNLYAGTEMLGALEGLKFLLNKKASNPNRQKHSTTVAMLIDGKPERRSWWDTRTSTVSDSVIGQSVPLPKSLGKKDITTSGLLYDNDGKPHHFKNNEGQWQWKRMQRKLNAALDRLADESTNPMSDVQVNLYGLNKTSNTSIDNVYQDLFTNQTFNNSSSNWSYSNQTIGSLQDINF